MHAIKFVGIHFCGYGIEGKVSELENPLDIFKHMKMCLDIKECPEEIN